jgi:hypothetical protein
MYVGQHARVENVVRKGTPTGVSRILNGEGTQHASEYIKVGNHFAETADIMKFVRACLDAVPGGVGL